MRVPFCTKRSYHFCGGGDIHNFEEEMIFHGIMRFFLSDDTRTKAVFENFPISAGELETEGSRKESSSSKKFREISFGKSIVILPKKTWIVLFILNSYFIYSLQEIILSHILPIFPNGKIACFGANSPNFCSAKVLHLFNQLWQLYFP